VSLRIGIDPGMSGAIAVVRDGTELVYLDVMPLIGQGKDRAVDCVGLIDILKVATDDWAWRHHTFAVLEQAIPMPPIGGRRMGTKSAFTQGASFQAALDALRVSQIAFERLAPATWRRWLPGQPKGRTETKAAIRRYVEERLPGLRKIKADQMDAIFLAIARPAGERAA
jgi:hypothetical protein